MKYEVFCYFDKETEKFNPPFFAPMSYDDTVENVIDGVKKGKVEDAKAFDLYHLGSYDTADGVIVVLEKPKRVISLENYVVRG